MAQFKSKTGSGAPTAQVDKAPVLPSKQPAKTAARKVPAKAATTDAPASKPASKIVLPKLPAKPAAPAVPAELKEALAKVIHEPQPAPAPLLEMPVAEAEAPLIPAAPVVAPVPEPAAAPPEPDLPEPDLPEPDIIAPAPVEAEATTIEPMIDSPNSTPKEIVMATDFNTNVSDTMSGAVTDVQAKLQSAYEKSTTMVTEMTELAKGNVEALVESTKLFTAGVQDLSKSYADEAKSAYETATADIKEMAAIKSPTELFQLQGKILRRNFEMLIAATSKSTDAAMKLANESMAPLSGRVNLATEKLTKVAA
jgi:phasin family protein